MIYLRDRPFNHGTASHRCTIDLLEVVIRVAQVAVLHLLADIIAN